jgi:hypothetical protein
MGRMIHVVEDVIDAQKANGNIVRFLMFAHVNDSANIEVAAYLYVDVSNGSVNAYCGARNADFNQDGTVDFIDYSIMSYHAGYCSGQPGFDPVTDLDADGCTNIIDVSIFNVVYSDPAYR